MRKLFLTILKKQIEIIMVIVLIAVSSQYVMGEELQLKSKSAVLIDADNGRILYGKDAQQKMPMASTTKIMTCIIALENCSANTVMSVSEKAQRMPKVHMNAKKGEQYYLKDLLYAMMLESYNDVAMVVAENVAGSQEKFALMMNKKAKEIGAVNTNFVTPNGLDADQHYSTAYDMALIGAYAVKNEDFLKIVNTKSYTLTDLTGKRKITVSNKDAFLTMDSDALGIKTGFTGKAGYCFVGAVKSNERTFVSCVLACGWPPNKSYKWHDTKALMTLGKQNYNYKVLLEEGVNVSVGIENGTKDAIKAQVCGESRCLVSEKEQIETKTDIDYKLPIHLNDTVGYTKVFVNGETVEIHKIVAKETVEKYDFAYCIKKTLDSFIFQ